MKIAATAFGLFVLAATPTLADPTGIYDVEGMNADGRSTYRGTVEVVRTGETYGVYWTIGDQTFIGTGIGARFLDGRIEMGPATRDDTGLSVGYVSDSNFGIAMYFEQPDGVWKGVWTYGGSESVAGEIWVRR
jgi:hypothetical protein